jgi:hypothetical protein
VEIEKFRMTGNPDITLPDDGPKRSKEPAEINVSVRVPLAHGSGVSNR